MTVSPVGVLVLLGVGFIGGVWACSRWHRRKTVAAGRRPRRARRPRSDGKGWAPTALYRWRGEGGTGPRRLLYAGISSEPQLRTNQHVADPDKVDMIARADGAPEVQWFPDRYQALAAEWALIDEFRPPFNRAPSGTCDSWTEKRPPVRRGRVSLDST